MAEFGKGPPGPEEVLRPAESVALGWLLDGLGLAMVLGMGWLVAFTIADLTLGRLAPGTRGSVPVPPLPAFLLGFAGLDYLQYWTHRLFHGRVLWRFHLLHHTLARMNGSGAFRHSLWECLLNPVSWCHGAIAWLLTEPSWYLIAVSTGILLDVWRHAPLETHATGHLRRVLHFLLVTPEDHALHHGRLAVPANFGGNLKVWDRLHGTYQAPAAGRGTCGVEHTDGILRLLFGAARRPFAIPGPPDGA